MAKIVREYVDPDTGKRVGGGGKLNRSETVTVRLDPKLNYLCELSARSQRRTKSSFIEWAVEMALSSVTVPGTFSSETSGDATISNLGVKLYDVDEVDRLLALTQYAPALMDHEEQLLWKSIRMNGYLWRGNFSGMTSDGHETWNWDSTTFSNLILERLREHFADIKAYVRGETNGSAIPQWQRTRPIKPFDAKEFDADLDSDVPF